MLDFEDLDHYELLGVTRTASPDEIRRAYRREISKYHPDRFVHAPPDKQAYAQRRSQHITEAYSTLNDFSRRTTYNRGQTATRPTPPTVRATPPPPQARDHQAELYDQARAHLAAGRTLQGIAVLRQLQQINPFYRDSAELLAAAESQSTTRKKTMTRGPNMLVVMVGGVLGLTVAALAVWTVINRPIAPQTGSSPKTAVAAAVTASAPTVAPQPTTAATLSVAETSATAAPTALPTVAPTAEPTVAPTAEPTAVPTAEPTVAPTAVLEDGAVVLSDAFNGSGWADLAGNSWRVGYVDGRYQVVANAGAGVIWSYRSGVPRNATVGVDVQVPRGEGGLLLRFVDEQTYLSFSIDPSVSGYRLEQHSGGVITALAAGESDAILPGADTVNRIIVKLAGTNVTMYANGEELGQAEATGVGVGARYGLLAVGGQKTSEVFFDNLQIRTP